MSLLIIGHSFVCRLKTSFGEERLRVTVSDTFRAVNMEGTPGLTVDRLARKLARVNDLSPSVIVIDIGTNDISARLVIPERLARQIVDVALMFSRVSSVEAVVILPILPRILKAWAPRPTRDDFNDARLLVNRTVAAIVSDIPGVYTWKQRCIRLHPERFFIADGIHLNSIGLRRYLEEVRRASLFGARRANR